MCGHVRARARMGSLGSGAVIRLYVEDDLAADGTLALTPGQTHYLRDVMRRRLGDEVLLFNGRDGEWRAIIEGMAKKAPATVSVVMQTRRQGKDADLWLVFAAIKPARMATLAEKACELGVSRLCPVITARTQGGRINTGRLSANAVEAAEQCGRLSVPEIAEAVALHGLIESWPAERRLWVADERGQGTAIRDAAAIQDSRKSAILVGPEGGFSPEEVDFLTSRPFAVSIDLGPRILRADTAAIAALAVFQAMSGDWPRDS